MKKCRLRVFTRKSVARHGLTSAISQVAPEGLVGRVHPRLEGRAGKIEAETS